ncbi:hypothetical protein BDW22DRAFT_1409168 [Trametopsis cervina]|nr:hypothetical protein BDW22DRAFT_1409168 [Trametopsis cervina]
MSQATRGPAGSPTLNNEKTGSVKVEQGPTQTKPKTGFLDKLPPWITTNLKSRRSQKTWLRCWIASWAAYILLLPNASLRVLGNAAFFGLLGSLMMPPNLPVQLFLFVLTTMVFGMCLGWGLGAAAMRAALAARDQVLLQSQLQREAQSAAGLANPDALFRAAIFEGQFLDTRSSIIYGVFLGVGIFIFAFIRAYAPKLTLMSVFGTIAIDIYCSYGPLFPFAQYTLLNSLLTSVACYIAIGMVVIIFVFPQTANHAALVTASALTGQFHDIIDQQQVVLDSSLDELEPGKPLATALQRGTSGIIGQIQAFTAGIGFIKLEFSWGKWNAEDVSGLKEPLVAIVSRLAALQSFAKLVGRHSRVDSTPAPSAAPSEDGDSTVNDPAIGDTYLLRQFRERNLAAESAHNVRISDVMPFLRDATADLRGACSEGLAATKAVLDGINTRRYSRSGDKESEQQLKTLDVAIEHIQASLAEFKEDKRLLILQPFQDLIESAKNNNMGPLPFRALYSAYVFAANLIIVSEAIENYMVYVQTVAAKRRKNRLWAPGGIRALVKALKSKGDASDQAAGEDHEPPAEHAVETEQAPYRHDPDSRPPNTAFQRGFGVFHHLYKWTKTPEALFVFRYVVITILLWLPSVLRSSAHFAYSQKSLWALIMAQTTMNIYASDQIFNLFTRLLGTFVGGVFGLVTWYIGAGRGSGNPYGLAAIVGVVLVPIIFFRLFTPPTYLPGVLLLFATWVLIVGYSWLDTHLVIAGNPGKGWDVAWRRWVLVTIGAAASFIIMMLPPKSGRKAVRLRNASVLMSLASLYSDITAAWISSDGVPNTENTKSTDQWIASVRAKIVSLAAQLQALKMQTSIARWEGSLRGVWPIDEYMKLADEETQIMANLSLLGGSLAQMDNETRAQFLRHTVVVNPNFIADVMATFSLLSQALRTGEPLPQAFHQNLIDRLQYHGADHPVRDEAHRAHLESVGQLDYVYYACAIAAVFQILEGLNECRAITTRLCGEVPLQGWNRWKNQYDRAYADTSL